MNKATSSAARLESGSCGLTDGSKAGQWRLPTKDELVRRAGNKQGFNSVQADYYWSSSTYADDNYYRNYGWVVGMPYGNEGGYTHSSYYVWPVRNAK